MYEKCFHETGENEEANDEHTHFNKANNLQSVPLSFQFSFLKSL